MGRFDDDLYFLVVALRQVSRGRELLEHLGHPMPPLRQDALVRAWRNIEEHWDDPGRGEPISALKAWAQESDEVEPGLTHSGTDKLHTASGLRIKWVRKDRRAPRKAVGAVSETEWHHCYITAEEAAAILGMPLEEFDRLLPPPMNLDFEGEDGVRFFREAVEARAAGHLLPPRWVQQGWVQPGYVGSAH